MRKRKRTTKPVNTKREDMGTDQRPMSSADNDWSWYAQNPQLLKDYASYPFGNPLGCTLTDQNSYFKNPIPGVCTIWFAPSIGYSTDETSPINVAMRKLYSYVRHANSGAANYDAPDLMLYVLCVDSARMYLEWMKRIYGVFFNYTAFNRYYPRILVEAMGGDYDNLEANLAAFRGYINQYAVKLNQLWVPEGLSYTKRHQWLCSHYYVDSQDSYKAQTYVHVPYAYYRFEVTGDPAVGQATLVDSPAGDLAAIIRFGNGLLNPLITNEDIGIMSGDILKAYGANGVAVTTGIAEDYRVLPEYSKEVLSQIENCTLCGTNIIRPSFDVTQDTTIGGGFLKSSPKVNIFPVGSETLVQPQASVQQNIADALAAPITGPRMLNLHHSDVKPEDVIVATRGMAAFENPQYSWNAGNTAPQATVEIHGGSEVYLSATFLLYNVAQGKTFNYSVRTADWTKLQAGTIDNAVTKFSQCIDKFGIVEQFDWHPLIYPNVMVSKEQDYSWTKLSYPFIDTDNYTFVSPANIKNMHMTALLSEFTIPMV